MSEPGDTTQLRAEWLGLLARAAPASLAAALSSFGPLPAFETPRPAQSGLVMTRGRAGGVGGAFNLGEATATRCVVRLASGETGVGYVLGRDRRHAQNVALCDAMLQGVDAARIRASVLAPLAAEQQALRAARASKAAATRVEFFTLVRGED